MIIVRAFTSLKRKRRLEFEGCLRLRFRLVGPVKKSKPAVWVSEAQPTGAGLCPRALGLRGIGLTPEVGGCARLDHGLAPVVTRAPSPTSVPIESGPVPRPCGGNPSTSPISSSGSSCRWAGIGTITP